LSAARRDRSEVATALDAALRAGALTTASLDAALRHGREAAATLTAILAVRRSVSVGLEAVIAGRRTAFALLDAALQRPRSASAAVDSILARTRAVTAGLDSALRGRRTAPASLDAALRRAYAIAATLDARLALLTGGAVTASLDAWITRRLRRGLESDDDRASFLAHGHRATWQTEAGESATFAGLWVGPWSAGEFRLTGATPQLTCRSRDLPPGAGQGDRVFVATRWWRVREIRRDGTGMAIVDLQR
jgi:hypothetical protein